MGEHDPYRPPQSELASERMADGEDGEWRTVPRCWLREMGKGQLALVDVERQPLLWLKRPSFLSRELDFLLPGEPRRMLGLRLSYALGLTQAIAVIRDRDGVLGRWERGWRGPWTLVDARDKELVGATAVCERVLLVIPRRALVRDRLGNPIARLYLNRGWRLGFFPPRTPEFPRELALAPLVLISRTR